MTIDYKSFIEENFLIINKDSKEVPFVLNPVQLKYLDEASQRDIILKARQQGFSSEILAIFTTDFILSQNNRSVVVADVDDNASELLDRVKQYISSYEYINKIKIPLKYNSKNELYNAANGSRYTIGTAKSAEFGRSKTINNLHLSEAAFYPDLNKLLVGAGNAVTESGRLIIETTANGFNELKQLWDKAKRGESDYQPLFYPASDFYTPEQLEKKRRQSPDARTYRQEYPESDIEAFITSGNPFFDSDAMQFYLENVKEVIGVS